MDTTKKKKNTHQELNVNGQQVQKEHSKDNSLMSSK